MTARDSVFDSGVGFPGSTYPRKTLPSRICATRASDKLDMAHILVINIWMSTTLSIIQGGHHVGHWATFYLLIFLLRPDVENLDRHTDGWFLSRFS